MVCLCIPFDTVKCTISIPDDMSTEVMEMCHLWSQIPVCKMQEVQSFLGSLLYVGKCVKPARIFLNRMLQFL